MDGFEIRPVLPATTPTSDVRRQDDGRGTELQKTETVTEAKNTENGPVDRQRDESASATRKTLLRDTRSNTIVFRTIDVESGDVVEQVPEDAVLKIRAYVRLENEAAEVDRNA